MAAKVAPKGSKPKTKEDIFNGFQNLRIEQRQMANKITELEMDLGEHKIVIETLRATPGERKCFRMNGGVLAERTVAEVLPELEATYTQLPRVIAGLNDKMAALGVELNKYIAEHGIRVQREAGAAQKTDAPEDDQPLKSNVLVAQ